ncbi:hypothetical protein [Methylotuvimicrobium sp. KM1]|uniref:hypothetical protein n=1 Tax=Methylotuvimicrobium sp. KM1 TaxID=3377707 RepID=UPI00384F4B78
MTEYTVFSDLEIDKESLFLNNVVSNINKNIELLKNSSDTDSEFEYSTVLSIKDRIIEYINIPNYQETKKTKIHSFQELYEWEGCINQVEETFFTAALIDITEEETIPTEEADFDINSIPNEDRLFIHEGAIFRWILGYERFPNGSKKNSSKVVFRRNARWTTQNITNANKKAEEFKKINWE